MNEIAQNIAKIKGRMAEACKKAGRNPEAENPHPQGAIKTITNLRYRNSRNCQP